MGSGSGGKALECKPGPLSSGPRTHTKPAAVAHVCHPSIPTASRGTKSPRNHAGQLTWCEQQ